MQGRQHHCPPAAFPSRFPFRITAGRAVRTKEKMPRCEHTHDRECIVANQEATKSTVDPSSLRSRDAVGDDGTHAAEWDDLAGKIGDDGRWRLPGFGERSRCGFGTTRGKMLENVVFGDAAGGARAGNAAKVEVVFAGDAAHEGRGAERARTGGRSGSAATAGVAAMASLRLAGLASAALPAGER